MPQLLIVFLVVYALRGLAEQTKRDWAKWRNRPLRPARPGRFAAWWRRHVTAGNAGYWGHQAVHGFPTARHGLHDGWTRGREAHHRAQRGIERNRAEHAEGRAEHEPELAEYRRRRAAALAEIDRQRQQEEIDRAHDEALIEDEQRTRWTTEPDEDVLTATSDLPEDEPDPPEDAQQDQPEPAEAPAAQGSKGEQTMTETTYQGVKDRMAKAAAEAEERHADAEESEALTEEHLVLVRQAKDHASNAADEMQALKVDSGSLSAMAEHLEALDAEAKAAQNLHEAMGGCKETSARVQETAQAVTAALDAGGHGALDEAHANAAGGGAEREFYGEGASAGV